jgi:hypothetical protein
MPTNAVTKAPTHLIEHTQPIDQPVKTSQSHQSSPKALRKSAVQPDVVALPKNSQYRPRTRTSHPLVSLVVEFDEAEDRGESEEEQHRVEEDEPGNAQPSDVCGVSTRQPTTNGRAHLRRRRPSQVDPSCVGLTPTRSRLQTPDPPQSTQMVTQCLVHLDHPNSPAVHQAIGTNITPNEARKTLIAVYGTSSGYSTPDLNSNPPPYPLKRPARPTSILPSGGCTSK